MNWDDRLTYIEDRIDELRAELRNKEISDIDRNVAESLLASYIAESNEMIAEWRASANSDELPF